MRMRSLLLPVAAVPGLWLFGGWAVVTVENPPQALVAGTPYTLEYTVRQHGVTLLFGLRGSVEAVSGQRRINVESRGGAVGRYAATVNIPEPGDWTITVHSGFGPSKTTLLPLRVGKAGSPVVAMADAELGKHLFAAKGCMTCHVEMKVAPDPRTQTYDGAFLQKLLTDPRSVPKRRPGDVEMPNLGLKSAEISALTAYLMGPNSAGSR